MYKKSKKYILLNEETERKGSELQETIGKRGHEK